MHEIAASTSFVHVAPSSPVHSKEPTRFERVISAAPAIAERRSTSYIKRIGAFTALSHRPDETVNLPRAETRTSNGRFDTMNIQYGFEDPACRSGFVSIGNFDGVHLGHQRMVSALVRHARRSSCPSVVLTFDPPPLALLRPDQAPPRLCTTECKAQLLAELGVDCLLVYPTDRQLLNLSPREFFENILLRQLAVQGVVEGPNFCFGKDRAGTADTLRDYCAEAGVELEIVEGVTVSGRLVSSSEIRRLIGSGKPAQAAEMLGRPYRITGVVTRGAARGLDLGFPTANLSECATLLPGEGVYAGLGVLRDTVYPAAIHIGPNLTFADRQQKTEVHLIDYSGGNLYGETLSVDILDRLRDTMQFGSAEALQQQLSRDVAAAQSIVGGRQR